MRVIRGQNSFFRSTLVAAMNRKLSSRISRNQALAVWLLSFIVCCGSSLIEVYLAFDRRSLFLFAVSDWVEYGIGLGMFCTLIVASCACSTPLTFKLRIAAVIAAGIGMPAVTVGLWFFAVMEALSRV
jgi:hypothetical protein